MNIEQVISSLLIHDIISFNDYKLTPDMFYSKEFKIYIAFIATHVGEKNSKELNQIFLTKQEFSKHIFLSLKEVENLLEVFKNKTLIEQLYKHAIKETLKNKMDMIEGSLTDKTALEEIEEILKDINELIRELSNETVMENPADRYREYLADIVIKNNDSEIDNDIIGVSSSFISLDFITKGFKTAEYVIIAGRPSMGKTAAVLDIIASGILNGLNMLFLSIEMPTSQIIARLIPKIITSLELRHTMYGEDYENVRGDIERGLLMIENSNLYIEDFESYSSVTMLDIEKISRKYQDKYGDIDLGALDYIQLLSSPLKTDDENIQTSYNSKKIKALCKSTRAPWLILSQLSRNLEQRSDKRPLNSDLRNSGSLEQDADLIIFPYRENVYLERDLREQISKKPENIILRDTLEALVELEIENAEIIVSKNRNGPIGTANVQFHKKSASYINIGDRNIYGEEDIDF